MNGQNITTFLCAFLIAMVFVPAAALYAKKSGAMSHIDARRRRARTIPLLGGVAIFLTVAIVAAVMHNEFLSLLLLSALPVTIVGAIDDYKELSARPKLFAQLLSATLWVITRPEGALVLEQAGVPASVSQVITILWIVGITNALNLTDGMDGVAGGTAFMVSVMVGILGGSSFESTSAFVVAGATLGFLFYNLPPARIYLGDSGSGFLGFTAASFCSVMALPASTPSGIFVPLLLLAFPQVDTVLAIARRIKNGKPVFIGDHSHLHHKLQKVGFRVRHALIIIYVALLYCALGAFTMWRLPAFEAMLVLTLTVMGLTGALAVVFLWDHILGGRITQHTHAMITDQLGRQNLRTGVEKTFAGLAVNLASCYREFQHCTPDRTEAFALDFARMAKKSFPDGLFKTDDKSSVIIFFVDAGAVKHEQVNAFRVAFKSLMRAYNVLGNEEDNLDGAISYMPAGAVYRIDRPAGRRRAA